MQPRNTLSFNITIVLCVVLLLFRLSKAAQSQFLGDRQLKFVKFPDINVKLSRRESVVLVCMYMECLARRKVQKSCPQAESCHVTKAPVGFVFQCSERVHPAGFSNR